LFPNGEGIRCSLKHLCSRQPALRRGTSADAILKQDRRRKSLSSTGPNGTERRSKLPDDARNGNHLANYLLFVSKATFSDGETTNFC
jgi:hypothetical protein